MSTFTPPNSPRVGDSNVIDEGIISRNAQDEQITGNWNFTSKLGINTVTTGARLHMTDSSISSVNIDNTLYIDGLNGRMGAGVQPKVTLHIDKPSTPLIRISTDGVGSNQFNAAFIGVPTSTNAQMNGSQSTDLMLGATGGGNIRFGTSVSQNLQVTTRVVIDKTGQLGIGTFSPQQLVHIKEGVGPQLQISAGSDSSGVFITAINEGSTENEGIISFGAFPIDTGGGSWSDWEARSNAAGGYHVDQGVHRFYGDGSLSVLVNYKPTERFTVLQNGNVGINVGQPGNPQTRLHVTEGSIQFSDSGAPFLRIAKNDVTLTDRMIQLGIANTAGNFATTSVSGDAVWDNPTNGNIIISKGQIEKARFNKNNYFVIGNTSASTQLHLKENIGNPFDAQDYKAAAITLQPQYSASAPGSISTHNYIDVRQLGGDGSVSVANAAVMRFNAAAGTHLAVDAGTTKTLPGTVDAWVKVNIAGTIYYMPAYTSKN